MAKEKKHTGMSKQMDDHVFSILKVLNSIDAHLASLVYHQSPSRGFGASIEKAVAQPYVGESKKIEDNIEKLVIEELKKLNEENK